MVSSFVCKREKNSVVASQRRLERKLKELNLTLDEERQTHTEQKDQVFAPVTHLAFNIWPGKNQNLSPRFHFAAPSEGEGSEEAGGWRGDGAGEDRDAEEEGPEGPGGAAGAQGRPADQGHSSGGWAQVSLCNTPPPPSPLHHFRRLGFFCCCSPRGGRGGTLFHNAVAGWIKHACNRCEQVVSQILLAHHSSAGRWLTNTLLLHTRTRRLVLKSPAEGALW